jgi:hypothetical protein
MRFESEGVKYEVDFQHRKEKVTVPPNAPKEKQVVKEAQITTCSIIQEGPDGGHSTTAQAICRPPDQFSKPLGRKLALTRALKISGLSENMKKAIWDKYLQSLDVKRKSIAGNSSETQGLWFIQTPKKMFVSAVQDWQSNNAFNRKASIAGTSMRPSVPCPLPMEHPFFSDPEGFGFKAL